MNKICRLRIVHIMKTMFDEFKSMWNQSKLLKIAEKAGMLNLKHSKMRSALRMWLQFIE